jgi:hypothetical protein
LTFIKLKNRIKVIQTKTTLHTTEEKERRKIKIQIAKSPMTTKRGNLLHDIIIFWRLPKHSVKSCFCQVPLESCGTFARTHHLAKTESFALSPGITGFEDKMHNFPFLTRWCVLANMPWNCNGTQRHNRTVFFSQMPENNIVM